MKNIIIAGPPRAGKSTLARKINKELGHSIINLDGFVWAFKKAFPQLGIKDEEDAANVDEIHVVKLAPFLAQYINIAS